MSGIRFPGHITIMASQLMQQQPSVNPKSHKGFTSKNQFSAPSLPVGICSLNVAAISLEKKDLSAAVKTILCRISPATNKNAVFSHFMLRKTSVLSTTLAPTLNATAMPLQTTAIYCFKKVPILTSLVVLFIKLDSGHSPSGFVLSVLVKVLI